MSATPRFRPLAGLTRANLGRELTAGVTLIAIAIPLNIGYAQIAGLPATAGLYALIVPTVLYALLASSRQLVVSPDAAAAALVASSIGGLAAAGSAEYASMALAQCLIGGVLFIAMAFLKLGFIANFLSKPILVGFVGGLAMSIMVSQVAKMLGVQLTGGSEFPEKVVEIVTGLGSANGWSIAISAAAVAVLLAGRRLWPAVPWALIVLIAATVVVVAAGLDAAGVAVLGTVPAGLPALTWPQLDLATWLALIPSAIALTMVTTAEGLLVARSYSERRGYPNRPDRDLFALGAANLAAGVQGSVTVGASTSRTAAMDQAGSRTQLPSLVLAVGTVLLLLFGTALLADIPSPAIGAIVAVAIIPLLGARDFVQLWRMDRFEFLIAVVCFLVTLLIGSIPGILVALVLALVNLAKRAAAPLIDVSGADAVDDDGRPAHPHLAFVRLSGPLFFANGVTFTDAVKDACTDDVRYVVLDMVAVSDVDVTAAETFQSLRGWLTDRGITLAFTWINDREDKRLRRLGLLTDDDLVFETNTQAVAALTPEPGSEAA